MDHLGFVQHFSTSVPLLTEKPLLKPIWSLSLFLSEFLAQKSEPCRPSISLSMSSLLHLHPLTFILIQSIYTGGIQSFLTGLLHQYRIDVQPRASSKSITKISPVSRICRHLANSRHSTPGVNLRTHAALKACDEIC